MVCKENGIQRHRTAPGNPQQNGVAERMNRTMLEKVRYMLLASGMPKEFWGEAVTTAAALINRSPCSAIKNETPDSRWYGDNGNYHELRIFGCRAYAHVKQGKLNPRAIKCVMIGYQKGAKAYRLWCTEKGNQKVVVSRDVVFHEEHMPYLNDQNGAETQKTAIFDQQIQRESESDISSSSGASDSGEIMNQGGDGAHTQANPPENNQDEYMLARDRVRREVKRPSRFSDYDLSFFALCVAEVIECYEPATYTEAMRSTGSQEWLKAMKEEIDSLLKN